MFSSCPGGKRSTTSISRFEDRKPQDTSKESLSLVHDEINNIVTIADANYTFFEKEMAHLRLILGKEGEGIFNGIRSLIERLKKFVKEANYEGVLKKLKDFNPNGHIELEGVINEDFLERKEEIFSYIRHEINNILAIIDASYNFLRGEIDQLNLSLKEDVKIALENVGLAFRDLREFLRADNRLSKAFDQEFLTKKEERVPEKNDNKTIFIIDDEEMITKALERIVKRVNQNGDIPSSITFNSALMAKNAIEEGAIPDWILCDMMMPQMTGKMFYEWLESNYPYLADRIVFLSAGGTTSDTRTFLEEMRLKGKAIEKPFNTEEIRKAIMEALN